jgi:hypothetical protein
MKIVLLFLSQFLVLLVAAQTDFHFADSTAQWNVLVLGALQGPRWVTYDAIGDTVLRGVRYQVISAHQPFLPVNCAILRRDSLGRVYEYSYRDTADYLIYDFTRQPGDTFEIHNFIPGALSATRLCTVDSIGILNLDSPRKVMYVNFLSDDSLNPWIEGIGSLRFFAQPSDNYGLGFTGNVSYNLMCFFEKNQVVYHNPYHSACPGELPGAINVLDNNNAVVVSNPVLGNLLNISCYQDDHNGLAFKLFDLSGRMILQERLINQTNSFQLNQVSKGLYLYEIVSPGQILKSGKLVVR